MVAAERPHYSYLIDAEDRLAWVSPTWLAFARENGAAQLSAEAVLGQCLWSYIADPQTRQLYEVLMQQIRERGSRVVVPFRCDSPGLRRYMLLAIEPRTVGQVRFDSTLMRTEPRNHLRLLDATANRSAQRLTMCSLCQSVLIEPLGWMDVEEAMVHLRLLEQDASPQLRYSVCSACERASLAIGPSVH